MGWRGMERSGGMPGRYRVDRQTDGEPLPREVGAALVQEGCRLIGRLDQNSA
jgi:hypothetical protein